MKRTLSLVLVLAMVLSAMLGVMSFAEEAEEPTAALEVTQANLEFSNAVYLYIAVDYSAIGSADGITLKITNNKTGKSTVLAPNSKIAAPTGCVAFKYIDLGSKNMGDELTLQALKDGKASGAAKTYSVLEYALKAQGKGDAKLTKLMDAMLQYGADAQTAFDYEGTYDLDKDWGLVVVNGSNEGKVLAEAGTPVTFTPNTAKTGANAALYDMSINKIEGSIVVPAGSYKYYYIGDAQKTTFGFDMTTADAAVTTSDKTNIDNNGTTASVYPGVYFNGTKTGTIASPGGTLGTDHHRLFANVYPVTSSANRAGYAAGVSVAGENGYFKAYAEGKQSIAVQVAKNTKNLVRAMEDGVFTFAITVGKDGIEKWMTNAIRFRSDTATGDSATFLIAANNGNDTVFKTVNNNTATSDIVCTLEGVEGSIQFATIYIVVDINANTFTYYNSQNDVVFKTSAPADNKSLKHCFGLDDGLADNAAFFDLTGAPANNQHAMFQKMYIFEGNIFE